MTEYFKNRQKPASEIPDSEIEETFKAINDYFTAEWLASGDEHPVQILWKRKDHLASKELYILGKAIIIMSCINDSWVRENINNIKNNDINNIAGTTFEFVGLSYLYSDNQTPNPKPANYPSIDATLSFSNNVNINLSLKNYSKSSHERSFIQISQQFEKTLVDYCKKNKGYKTLAVYIDFFHHFPTESDWDLLFGSFIDVLDKYDNNNRVFGIKDLCMIAIRNLDEDESHYFDKEFSYTVTVSSVYHKNEIKNLWSKLDDACGNLKKYAPVPDENNVNFVYIRIPNNIDFDVCLEWAKLYFEQFSSKEIHGIIFYQPSIVTNIENDTTSLQHAFTLYLTDEYTQWNKDKNIRIETKIPVGIGTNKSSKWMLNINDKTIDFGQRYVHQSGHHYIKSQKDSNGSFTGFITKKAPGVFTHAVFEMIPGHPEMILSGHFSPDDRLLIL